MDTVAIFSEMVAIFIEVLYNYAVFLTCLIILLFSIFCCHYYYDIVRPPVVTCTSNKFKSFLKRSMPVLSEKYWPTIWCYESRLQTVLAYLLCPGFNVRYEREILTLNDGGQIALDWAHTENEKAPIILILPGIAGTSAENYVKRFVTNALDYNFRCVVYGLRGYCHDLELKTPKLSCVTDTSDTVQVVKHIRKRFPHAVVGACGISLGALVLTHYLVEHSHLQEISVAMTVGAPYDVFVAASGIESGLDIVFNIVLAWRLTNMAKRCRHILEATEDKQWDLKEVMKSKTVREFDERLIRKMYGYKSVDEYYQEAMIINKMHRIKIPVLCFSAADDLFQPFEYSEDNEHPVFDNEKVVLVLTAAGGHISHLDGAWPFWKKSTYMHRVFTQYFSTMFENDSFKQFS